MARLYDLTGDYAALYAQIEDCETDEEREALLAQIDALDAAIGEKAEAYARMMLNAQAEAEAMDGEIKRLQRMKKARENTAERMKERMHFAMEIAGATEIRTGIGKWKVCKNPWSVVVLDEAEVPAEFLIPQPAKVDKAAILARFKEEGEIPDGCDVVRNEGVRFR